MWFSLALESALELAVVDQIDLELIEIHLPLRAGIKGYVFLKLQCFLQVLLQRCQYVPS